MPREGKKIVSCYKPITCLLLPSNHCHLEIYKGRQYYKLHLRRTDQLETK